MWSYIAGKVLRNRAASVIIVFLITIFMGYHALDVKMGYTYISLLPKDDPTYLDSERFKEKFGDDGNVLIIGVKDSTFFKKEKFNDWAALQSKLTELDGVTGIMSVANVYELDKDSKNKKFTARKLFPNSIKSQQELDSIVRKLHNMPIYKDMVYFDKSHVYFMAITVKDSIINSEKREPFVREIEKLTNNWGEKYKIKIHYSGLPYTRTKIAEMIKKELLMFVLLAMAVTALILFMFFRSFKVVLFSSMVVGVAVIWAFGTIGLFGYDITILTGMIPPLLIVIGIPNSVFLLNKFHSEYKIHGNKIKALHRVIAKVGNATFLTNLTTAVGFATFVFTGNQALIEFGIIASMNIIGVFILSITLIYMDLKFFEKTADGVLPLEILISKKNKNDSLSYSSFVNINKFEESLSSFNEISKPLSLISAFKFVNQEYYKGKVKYYKFPDAVQAKRLLPYLSNLNGSSNNLLTSFIDKSYNTTRISLRVKDIGTGKMKSLKSSLEKKLKEIFPEEDYYTAVTGSSVVFAQGTGLLVNNQVYP